MSVDTLSNMTSAIKNTVMVGKTYLEVPYSRQSEEVAKAIKDRGFFESVKVFKAELAPRKAKAKITTSSKEKDRTFKKLGITLASENGVVKISQIKRISTPGYRVYKKSEDLGRTRGGFGYLIVSTSRGIMGGSEARKKKLGGEVICEIY